MKKFVAMLAVGLLAAPAMAAISSPHVAGSFQGWDAGSNPMTETAPGSGVWTATFTGLGANERHEFKITDGTWDNSFPGPNSWLYSDAAGDVTITYNTNNIADGWSPTEERLGLSTDSPSGWTAVGDWQSQVGGGDWDNANPATAMAPQGGGIYMLEAVLAPGNYEWKAVTTGAWDSISWDNRSTNTANWGFSTDLINDTVRFWVNGPEGIAKIEVIPEPATLGLFLLGTLAMLRRRR